MTDLKSHLRANILGVWINNWNYNQNKQMKLLYSNWAFPWLCAKIQDGGGKDVSTHMV